MDETPMTGRFESVVIASRVGDAMGTPTEALEADEIARRFGWVADFEGDGTDDSLMATILCELVADGSRLAADLWARRILAHKGAILAKRDKFFPSVLHMLEKLASGYLPSRVAEGNMPSTSSAMCIWPVGLANAGDPAAAAADAYEVARLIHTGEADHCTDAAAAVAAIVAAAFQPASRVRDTVATALELLRPVSGARMAEAIRDAVRLVDDAGDYDVFRARYHDRFRRPIFCDSLETVPAAIALVVLADGDTRAAVEFGANFGRDTDTIASMAGAMAAAHSGSVPDEWRSRLGNPAVADARGVAEALAGAARERHVQRLAAAAARAVLWEVSDHG